MQPAPFKDKINDSGGFASKLWARWFQLIQIGLGSVAVETIRIINTDSPYTILNAGINLVCDTDAGAITVNYPAGVQGNFIRVVNVGRSGNNVTLDGNGTEQINKSATVTLADASVSATYYDETEGWN